SMSYYVIYSLSLHDALPIFAYQAVFDKEFETAIDGFQYIVDEKGRNSSYYIEAKKGVLTTKRKQITNDPAYDKSALLELEADFIDRKSTRLNSSHVKISYAV